MSDYEGLEQRLSEALGLGRRPMAITFRDTPPAGVARFAGSEPSGCSFWRLAAAGRPFYTVPSDHYNCAIGSHTHAIPLPAERDQELEQTLSFMTGIGYVKMEEVPGIPRLSATRAPWCTRRSAIRRWTLMWSSSLAGPDASCSSRRPRSAPASACPRRFSAGPPAWRC